MRKVLGTVLALVLAGAAVGIPLTFSLQAVLGPSPSVLERRPAGDDVIYESEPLLRPSATRSIEMTLGPGDVGYAVGLDDAGGGRVLRVSQNPAIPAGWFDFDVTGHLTPLDGAGFVLPEPRSVALPAIYALSPAELRASLLEPAGGASVSDARGASFGASPGASPDVSRGIRIFAVGHYTGVRVPSDLLATRNIAVAGTAAFFLSGFWLRRTRYGREGMSFVLGRLWLALPFWVLLLGSIVPLLPRPLAILVGGGSAALVWAQAFARSPEPLRARAALRGLLVFVGFLAALALFGFGMQRALRDPGGDGKVVAQALGGVPVAERLPSEQRLQVWCIGSSSTEAETYSPAFRASRIWTALLERDLGKRLPDRTVRVVNLGKGATTSSYGLRLLDRALRDARPDWVVIDYVHNDWVMDLVNGTIIDGLAKVGVDLAKPRDLYRRNLVAMVEKTRASGARPVLILEPTSSAYLGRGLGLEGPGEQLTGFYEIVRDVGRELSVPVVDGNDPFVADRATRFEPFQDDGVHFNAWGHRQMAEYLAGVIDADHTAAR